MFALKVDNMKRHENTVLEYEQQPVEKGMILFYGSSGFTRWSTQYGNRPLEEDIRRKDGSPAAVNHGFGGGTIEEGLYYYSRMVKPWEPRAIVLRFFPNDVGFGYAPAEIVYLLAQFCNWARADFPDVKLYLCDAMPHKRHISNSTWQRLAKQFNRLLKDYCDANADCTYVCQSAWPGFYTDPADAGDYSKIRQDIWVADEMHFTQEGYDIYRDLFLNALDDIL
jgi:lysophospholipase L1-like esterase